MKKAEVKISIPITSDDQWQNITRAEQCLAEAGVDFDTGYDMQKNIREWEFDWSLKGANVNFKKPIRCAECRKIIKLRE